MAFQVGDSVGNYRILRKLGAGGMGEVFLAEHPLIGKSVALKVIHQDLAVNKEVVTRFINEAKAVSTIGNEHIVEVHDFGVTPEGAHFFIMEYLQGETLTGMVKRGPLPVDMSLHIAAQIASGLSAAHNASIVHRDLKPDNIMLIDKLGDSTFVKILDFGLAKMLEAEEQLTAMGVVLGTPEFMSPEAAESKGVDGRSDIYSLGVLLFQMLTARLPFSAGTMGELMVQHVCRTPPAPRSFNPNIPPSVEQIVLRCLAKSKDDRFHSMEDLRNALLNPDNYMSSSPPVVASEGARSSVSSNHPEMNRPTMPENRTMSIETGGYNSSGRGRMLIMILVALFSAAGGTAAAFVLPHYEAKSLRPGEVGSSEGAATDAAAESASASADGGMSGSRASAETSDSGPDEGAAAELAGVSTDAGSTEAVIVAKPTTRPKRPKPKRPKRPKKPKKPTNSGENTMAPSFD